MILPAQTIRKIQPVSPFCERTCHSGLTYGVSCAGYDVRIAETVVVGATFVLASTLEQFDMPDDVLATVHDKSSWARRGVAVQTTVVEPGWKGYLTLELTNHGDEPIEIQAGDPIAQIIFHRLEAPTELPYRGKYQDQQAGPQPARLTEREPSVGSLRRFRSWKKSAWKVGLDWRREAYANTRGGRYQIERYAEGFVVRYAPPYDLSDVFDEVGTAATGQEAIALAEAHNRRADGIGEERA